MFEVECCLTEGINSVRGHYCDGSDAKVLNHRVIDIDAIECDSLIVWIGEPKLHSEWLACSNYIWHRYFNAEFWAGVSFEKEK